MQKYRLCRQNDEMLTDQRNNNTVARPLLGYPVNQRKTIQQKLNKFCIVISVFYTGVWEGIFYIKTKFTTQKIYFLSKLPLEKLKIVRICFPAPFFCHFWPTLGGIGDTKIPLPKDFFAAPFELFCRILGHLTTVNKKP